MADPGGILISRKVHEEIERKLPLVYDDLGEQIFKNIAAPTRVYRVVVAHGRRLRRRGPDFAPGWFQAHPLAHACKTR